MQNNLYGKNMQAIIAEIDKKFEKVYKNNKEIVKNYLEKNEEDVKLRIALEHIKKGLYNSDKFVKENQGSILDAFIGNSKNKDFFSFILKIRNRLNQLEIIIKNPIFVNMPILENKFLVHANILTLAIFFTSLILANNFSLFIFIKHIFWQIGHFNNSKIGISFFLFSPFIISDFSDDIGIFSFAYLLLFKFFILI